MLVDFGSDDQQVPMVSDQLLWNPYWSSADQICNQKVQSSANVFKLLEHLRHRLRPEGSSMWRLDLLICSPRVSRRLPVYIRLLRSLIRCDDSRDVIGLLRGTALLLQPWKCWDFPAALERVLVLSRGGTAGRFDLLTWACYYSLHFLYFCWTASDGALLTCVMFRFLHSWKSIWSHLFCLFYFALSRYRLSAGSLSLVHFHLRALLSVRLLSAPPCFF